MRNITSKDIEAVCNLVDELCGIVWDDSKAYLIDLRLKELAKMEGCSCYTDLVRRVRSNSELQLKEEFINAVTTNETLWFRDTAPFEAIANNLIPELIDHKANTVFPNRIRIWSAACSTGQEAYSTAITLAKTIPDFQNWDIQIFGTDISAAAIEKANAGTYYKHEIDRGMKQEVFEQYFIQEHHLWKVHDDIRSLCSFSQRNLLEPFDDLGPFDIVLCRNVSIYFSEEARRSLFARIANILAPSGWILVGSSESLASFGPQWQPTRHCQAVCYSPNMNFEHSR